jgi:hypothetical protein
MASKKRIMLKDIAWLLTAITCVFGPPLFIHWSETANTKFWWNFWDVLAIVVGAGAVILWCIFWFSPKNKD